MLTLYIAKQRFDKDGKILESKVDISRSFVKNFLGCLYRNMAQLNYSMPDIHGDSRNTGYQYNMMPAIQADGGQRVWGYSDSDSTIEKFGDEVGILIGTGTSSVDAQDYSLSAKIDHGLGAGEMEYFGGRVNDVVIEGSGGSDSWFDIERIFRNGSGNPIVIKEYGFSVIAWLYATLIIRDSYSDPGDWVTVQDGEYFKVTYRIKVTV